MQFLPLNVFYKKKYFDYFLLDKFPNLTSVPLELRQDVELALLRNYRKWFGIYIYLIKTPLITLGVPRIVDYIFNLAQASFGSGLENINVDKERRDIQLATFDSMVTRQTEDYYNLSSVKAHPYLLVSVAAGIQTSRTHQIPGTSLTFGDFELKAYLFPANDLSTKILWATNLLTSPLLDSHNKELSLFVESKNYKDLDIIKNGMAAILDQEFSTPSDMLKMVAFDPFLTREFKWKRPQIQGEDDLEYTAAITMWLRYLIAKTDNQHSIVALKDIIYSLPSHLANGKK